MVWIAASLMLFSINGLPGWDQGELWPYHDPSAGRNHGYWTMHWTHAKSDIPTQSPPGGQIWVHGNESHSAPIIRWVFTSAVIIIKRWCQEHIQNLAFRTYLSDSEEGMIVVYFDLNSFHLLHGVVVSTVNSTYICSPCCKSLLGQLLTSLPSCCIQFLWVIDGYLGKSEESKLWQHRYHNVPVSHISRFWPLTGS